LFKNYWFMDKLGVFGQQPPKGWVFKQWQNIMIKM